MFSKLHIYVTVIFRHFCSDCKLLRVLRLGIEENHEKRPQHKNPPYYSTSYFLPIKYPMGILFFISKKLQWKSATVTN